MLSEREREQLNIFSVLVPDFSAPQRMKKKNELNIYEYEMNEYILKSATRDE